MTSIDTNPNQISGPVRRGLAVLVASAALYACAVGERPVVTEQTVPANTEEELGSLAIHTSESNDGIEDDTDFYAFLRSEERNSQISDWVLSFSDQLDTAAAENKSIMIASSVNNEGHPNFSYFIDSTDGMYSFTITGKADDNKLGLIPDSIYVDFTPIKDGEIDTKKGTVVFSFNDETNSYDSKYSTRIMNLDGSGEKINTHTVTLGGASVSTIMVGEEAGMSSVSLSAPKAIETDWGTYITALDYIERALDTIKTSE
jgi:hypothetical protein